MDAADLLSQKSFGKSEKIEDHALIRRRVRTQDTHTHSFPAALRHSLPLYLPPSHSLLPFLNNFSTSNSLLHIFLFSSLTSSSLFPPRFCFTFQCVFSLCVLFQFSHSCSVLSHVRALMSYCYIPSWVQMLIHVSLCACVMLVKDESQLSAEAGVVTLQISPVPPPPSLPVRLYMATIDRPLNS